MTGTNGVNGSKAETCKDFSAKIKAYDVKEQEANQRVKAEKKLMEALNGRYKKGEISETEYSNQLYNINDASEQAIHTAAEAQIKKLNTESDAKNFGCD